MEHTENIQNGEFINYLKEKRLADFKKQLDEIYEYVANTEDAADKALATVRDWNKDSEIQKLQEEVKTLKSKIYIDFTLTTDEYAKVVAWQNSHKEAKHRSKKYGYWTFEFTSTGLGLVGSCICRTCNEGFIFREP